MVGLGESWAQSQVYVADGHMRVKVDSPSYREEPCNHGCRNFAGSWGAGEASTWAQMPMCHHIIRQGVQVSRCPFTVGPCGLHGSESGSVWTQVRMSQLPNGRIEGKSFSLGWSQASALPQRNVASMPTSRSTTRIAFPIGALAPCPLC